MNRSSGAELIKLPDFPRASGDEPSLVGWVKQGMEFSPREWG